jgi:hypothetical protein
MTKARTLADNFAADINGITAGTGITGGGTSGTVTVTNEMATVIDAKGDLVGGTGADTFARLAVGANGTVLTADSVETTGLKWATPAGSSFVGAMARASGVQSISNATQTLINLAGTDEFDTDSIHDPSSNNTRMTIPAGKGGYYLVNAACPMEDIGASGNARLLIQVNGNVKFSGFNGASDGCVGNTVSGIVSVSAGDYIEMSIYQNGGTTTNTAYDGGSTHIFLTISKVG